MIKNFLSGAIPVLLAMTVTVAQAQVADGPQADATRASLEKFLAQTQTLEARFSQELFGDEPGRGPLDESSGKLTLKRPGKFRWDYTEPYEKTIVADGERLWIYEADLEQVIVRASDDSIAANPAMLLSGQASLDEAFVVQGSYQTGEIAWLELSPREKDSNFTTVRLGLDGGVLRLMELVDGLDQITRITFSDMVVNGPVADHVFTFEPPDGVDVQGLDD